MEADLLDRVRAERERLDLSYRDLEAATGVSFSTLARLDRGEGSLSRQTRYRLETWLKQLRSARDARSETGNLEPTMSESFQSAQARKRDPRSLTMTVERETAIRDVIAERERQKAVEGWTSEHDDAHGWGQMAHAAAWYAFQSTTYGRDFVGIGNGSSLDPHFEDPHSWCAWPWLRSWWKPSSPRRDLVKAAALILAEIERLDRAAEEVSDRDR